MGPITLSDSIRLEALVHSAKTIIDLGVVPVRTWRLVAECDQHGRITREETLSMADPTPDRLKCFLCALIPWKDAIKSATAEVLRG